MAVSNVHRMFPILLFCGILISGSRAQLCNIHCDGRDPSEAVNTRIPVSEEIFGRSINLYVSDSDNMAFAEMSNGNSLDELWIDRSFDGGFKWEAKVGDITIPTGSRSVRTRMYNVDNPSGRQIGALRACGKAADRVEIACTPWARSTVNAESQVDAAATAMMQLFDGTLWPTTGWWNGANCLTAMVDYFKVTGNQNYRYVIDDVFEKNKDKEDGNFTNYYIDDTLWWGLVWVGAYDVTGNAKYLEMAKFDADYCYRYKDDVCGGGLWWTTRLDYKNAIPNELFIKLAAALHNRIPGDSKYLNQAVEVWNWFKVIFAYFRL
jgi:hypothetical protein